MYDADALAALDAVLLRLDGLPLDQRVATLNEVRRRLHERSPFAGEPVDLVLWVPAGDLTANDYNPNSVAPPEMVLLTHSVAEDGYTQPIVTATIEGAREIVDGFHRHRVGREVPEIAARVHGYLPVTTLGADRNDRSDRIAATVRHNRARGKHAVTGMAEIVRELQLRNWSDDKIARKLGMDADEVLRLRQIAGLAATFADSEFSEAWEVTDG